MLRLPGNVAPYFEERLREKLADQSGPRDEPNPRSA